MDDAEPVNQSAHVRTFTLRWRNSALTEERMEQLYPALGVGEVGQICDLTGRGAPLVLEIGAGYGAGALAYAREHPGHDLLAVDVHRPGIARLMANAVGEEVGNLRVYLGDAIPLLAQRIAPGSVAAVHLFFPDPWPKARHAKRRFISQHNLDLVASAMQPGAPLLIATDQAHYAAHAVEQLNAHGRWTVQLGERPAWRPHDGFEAKGIAAGRTIHEIAATRP